MITADDIANAFRQCGVKRGDVLMLHVDAIVLAQLPPMPSEERFALLFKAMDEVLGEEGTLLVPAFSYSFTNGEDFDVANSPSLVGPVTEYFRHMPGVMRSRDPIFSVAVKGRFAKEFAQASYAESFGPDSVFDLLAKHDAWLACLGFPFLVTFIHYIEQKAKVDYRYLKPFKGTIIDGDKRIEAETRYYVRDLDRKSGSHLARLAERMKNEGSMASVLVGRLGLTATRASQLTAAANAFLAEDPSGLIEEGAKASR